jgi:hypothetical protein
MLANIDACSWLFAHRPFEEAIGGLTRGHGGEVGHASGTPHGTADARL